MSRFIFLVTLLIYAQATLCQTQLASDIDEEAVNDRSGTSVSLSGTARC